jgi:hypothetical protein
MNWRRFNHESRTGRYEQIRRLRTGDRTVRRFGKKG